MIWRLIMDCKYCGKNFETPNKCNAHIGWCSKNPNKKFRKSNLIEYNKRPRNLTHQKRYCLFCDKLLSITAKKYCNSSCQQKYNWVEKQKLLESGISTLTNGMCKKYLIEKFGEKCQQCGWNETNPRTNKIPIDLEHIDGNSKNNSLNNLKLLCPNCHSLTPTYKALNVGNGRYSRRQRYKEGKSF